MQVGYSVAQVYTLWSHCWGHLATVVRETSSSGPETVFSLPAWLPMVCGVLLGPTPVHTCLTDSCACTWSGMHMWRDGLFKVQTSDHQVFINCSFYKSSYYSLFSQKILHWRRASSVLQHSCHCFLPVLGTLEPSVVFRSLHTSCPLIYLWVKGLLSSKTELPFSPEHQ